MDAVGAAGDMRSSLLRRVAAIRQSAAMLKDLEVIDGAEAGAWIVPRLEGGFGGKVKQRVPNGYEAYVRVMHPTSDSDGNPVTWAAVASALGRIAHREMQWHRLAGASDSYAITGSEWGGGNPETGELEPASLEVLCRILASHTAEPEHCFFGLSTIYAGVEETYFKAALLRWPARDFVIFAGPLSTADQLGCEPKGAGIAITWSGPPGSPPPDPVLRLSHAPNLIWPADHSWFVASEYDLDSTLVGGSRPLIDSLLAAPELETWEVERGDSLQADADKVN